MSQASAASAMTAANASTCSERDHRGTLREASCPPEKLHEAGSPTRQAAGRLLQVPKAPPSSNRTGEAVVRMRRVSHHHMYMCHIIIICICVTSSYVECGGGRRQGCSGRVCRVSGFAGFAGCLMVSLQVVCVQTRRSRGRWCRGAFKHTLSLHTLSAHTLSLRRHQPHKASSKCLPCVYRVCVTSSYVIRMCHIRHAANACQVFSAHTLSTHTHYTHNLHTLSTHTLYAAAGWLHIYMYAYVCVCVCDDALPPPSQEPAALACCLFPASLCITSSYVHVSHHHMYPVSGLPMCHIII